MKGKIFLVGFVCLFFALAAQAQVFLKIDESKTTASFIENQLKIDLFLENSARDFAANVKLEILDAEDKILAKSLTEHEIKRGRQTLQIPVAFIQKQDAENLLWKRLRYTVSQNDSRVFVSGIVSLSEIMPEVFELQISAPDKIFAGMNLRAHAVAVHPFTKKPVKNVEIKGAIVLDLETESDEDEFTITAKGRTNSEGFATLDFTIPADAKIDDAEIKIKGEKNGISREADEYLETSVDSFVYLNTDKPIYQPSQKLFIRGLYLNPLKRPLAEQELSFEITDEEDETVFETTVKTSRFGIANVEWQIPENFKLGTYKIEVETDDGDEIGAGEFKVSRYDLPNFTVKTATDRAFYLPDQNRAEITVSAEYLFGKSVSKGKVRIVQEKERRWNYEEQEYETEEGATAEGETGADGKFTAQIDLTRAQENLRENAWERFEDLKFAAYFTDPTTNRTEMKRFDVRLSKEPIHIYFIRGQQDANPKIPFEFYVSTFYADGAPAVCDLKIRGFYENAETSSASLAEAKTNRYGASKTEIRIPAKPFPEAKDTFNFEILAADKKGNRALFKDNIDTDEEQKQIRVKTDKTVYLPNEPLKASIFSTETERMIFVDVLKKTGVVYSKQIRLGSDGRASVQIPFRPDFKGELTIAAYFNTEEGYRNYVSHSKTVLFPSAENLNFNLKSLKSVYRPNEDARLSFNVQTSAKTPLETALGVVVLDKAIEERAAVEQLPDNFGSLRRLMGTAERFGNLTRKDLDNLHLTKTLNADLQLAAEFLLAPKSYEPNFFASDSYNDDFEGIYKNYFSKKLEPFSRVLQTHYEKTGEFPTDDASLRQILTANDINFENLRDAWANVFRADFKRNNAHTILTLKTAGADKKFGTGDDFAVKEMRFNWFAKRQNQMSVILNNYLAEKNSPPQTSEELINVWKQNGFDFDALRDEWNRPLYLDPVRYTRGTQKIVPETIGTLDGERQQTMRTKTVSQEILLYRLKSAGADGVAGGYDDFELASFIVVLSEKDLTDELSPGAKISKSRISSASGAIGGTLFDQNGAIIPNMPVTAENQSSGEKFSARSDEKGEFLLANLPSGKYKVSIDAFAGFKSYTVENIVVTSMNLIKLEIYLEVGNVSSTVDVSADNQQIVETTSSSISVTKSESKSIVGELGANKSAPNFTPRVREYFPETLLWKPELITDKYGRAELEFKLGDNLTTWKLYAVGSTETGEIGLIEREFQTFQPFFAELDPPKILTEGDQISLPVPVRNYTDKKQKVAVAMAENDWAQALNGTTQTIEIAPNAAQNAIFDFRAVSPVINGKQKVTALAKSDGDAIEKTVTVKPNGKEEVLAQSNIFQTEASFEVNFPADAFPANRKTEIKIYPNMLAHVAESVEGLLKRPYGCGEQTTSSTYPNLLILKIEKEFGKTLDPKIKTQARAFLEEGYARLLNYQTASGGFSYWGKTDTPNVALTAYVLRFLTDAKDFIEVDETVIESAQKWLLTQQNADGSWKMSYANADVSTAYVVRSLTLLSETDEAAEKSLQSGLEFLRKRLPETRDAFVLANAALAASRLKDAETAQTALEKLENLAQTEKNSLYWKTAGTPFYGWGKTAEIETTALAVQAFLKAPAKDEKSETMIAKGLAFLLKNKDKYGVWHSTQTTVNVLDALVSLQKTGIKSAQNADEKVEIFVNGVKAQEIGVSGESFNRPFSFDLSSFLNQENNRVEVKAAGNTNLTMAQIVSQFYRKWESAETDSRYFDLKVDFDKTEAKIGEGITCKVNVGKKYDRGGMILTEIGIPPGADVDRAGLETAKREGKFSNFDVLPDKIVIYLWASSKPLEFSFKFRPRYGINAQNAPSVVYDYYNEEAKATLAPVKFLVK
jgi:uncharacterized protein YfaS (alpha-2-macroglobulin family)